MSRRKLRDTRQRVQMVFQDPFAAAQSAPPRRRPGGAGAGGPRRAAARGAQRACELFTLVGLDPAAADRFPHEFSGGQRQRIGLARWRCARRSWSPTSRCRRSTCRCRRRCCSCSPT
ncbi:MAG: ATP-binding cassette domain-containing protein [Rubrivivax sp.]